MDNLDRATKIMQECGFIKNFVKEMKIKNEIRVLEVRLRTISKTESPSPEQYNRLEKLRRYGIMINNTKERSISCSKARILKEIIFQ